MKKLSVALILAGVLTGDSGAQAIGAAECTVATLQQKAPADTTITAAAIVPAAGTTPEYCRVDGHVATPGNTVNFRLGLPAAWNGKFLFEGVGGFGGTIGPLTTGLEKGYASASTDTGHQGATTDASWALNNPAKRIDYAYRGTHVTAVAAKALSQAYYGSAPRRAYFDGCSNGGRQALMEAQRYPEDFDGIIAGRSVVRHDGTDQAHARLSDAAVVAGALSVGREDLAARERRAGKLRRAGRPRRRTHHRSARVHLQAGVAEVRRCLMVPIA